MNVKIISPVDLWHSSEFLKRFLVMIFFQISISLGYVWYKKHAREGNYDLYYWAEIAGQHTQTFNI